MASVAAQSKPEEVRDQQEHGVKRRQSEEPDETVYSKRQRTSPGKNSPTATRDKAAGEEASCDTQTEERQPTTASDARRKSSTVDEKQRSKRLFGALLGNLRQPGDRTSKRRQEIESRKKAELKLQDDERLEDRQRRQGQLAEQRKLAQVTVDEQNMHRRHKAMLDKANFLETETEPRLFYRPWDLRDEEEGRVDRQGRDAQGLIDKEVAEFNERHGRESNPRNGDEDREADKGYEDPRLGDAAKDEVDATPLNGEDQSEQDQASAKFDPGEDASKADASDNIPMTETNDTNNDKDGGAETRPSTGGADDDGGDDGEHVQEGDEDTVIY